MASFNQAIGIILIHEGRFANNPDDPGGVTNWGISLRFLMKLGDLNKDGWPDGDVNHDGNVNAEDVKQLTKEQAIELYRTNFWEKNNYYLIKDQTVATKIFDLAVNMGSYAAHRVAQRAVKAASGSRIKDDGIIGTRTIIAINVANPAKLMVALKCEAAAYYRALVHNNPKLKIFLDGWLNRAYDNIELEGLL